MSPRPVELRAVKAELDVAKKTIDRYTHLVTKLYDELDTLRNSICNQCRTKFVPGVATSLRSSSNLNPGPIPLWRRLLRGLPDLGSLQIEATSLEPTSVPPPADTQPQASGIANSPITEPDEGGWSVEYNNEVKQALDIQLAHTLKMKSAVVRLKFSRDGKYLALGLYTGETYIYDLKTLSYRILTIVEYHAKEQSPIVAIQFSPDDKYIAIGGLDEEIRIWNIAERRVLCIFRYNAISVDFSPNGRFLVSGSMHNSIRIWCIRDGSLKKRLNANSVTSTIISPDGRYVAAGNLDGILRIWDLRSGQLLRRWKAKGDVFPLWSVVFTSDGKGLLSGSVDKTLRLWNMSSLLASQSGSGSEGLVGDIIDEEKECLTFQQHTATISISPDNRWVLESGDSTVRIWDARTGDWQCILKGHEKIVEAAGASADGFHLATGCNDGLVRVWRYEQFYGDA